MDVLQVRAGAYAGRGLCDRPAAGTGVDGDVSPLPSERDQNFLLRTSGERFVLKIANADSRALLEAQNAALRTSPGGRPSVRASCPRSTAPASPRSRRRPGARHFVRLLTWIPMVHRSARCRTTRPSCSRISAGRRASSTPRSTASIIRRSTATSTGISRRACDLVASSPLVADAAMRALVTPPRGADRSARRAPFAGLRRAAVHNDPNDYNVLVSEDRKITGILDFGDIVHSLRDRGSRDRHRLRRTRQGRSAGGGVPRRHGLPGRPAARRRRDRVAVRARAPAPVHERLHGGAAADRSGPTTRICRSARRRSRRTLPRAGGARSGRRGGGVPPRARQDAGGDAGGAAGVSSAPISRSRTASR